MLLISHDAERQRDEVSCYGMLNQVPRANNLSVCHGTLATIMWKSIVLPRAGARTVAESDVKG